VPREIERKFLVADDGWRAHADAGSRFLQAYLAETDKAVLRVRIVAGASAFLTVKSVEPGVSRQEFEYPIPVSDAEALISLRQDSLLEKTRFRVPHDGQTFEVDVYAGENEGLVVAEIELESENEAVAAPPWLGREVTGDARYYAARLARRPFRAWESADRPAGLER
jgi:adenylate cyclase